ncbi:MAG: HAD-IA family hydrolase [Armatimonadia bacterium]|nr:HAD-IA family hydrolase [Armatimonadia bacterium]
MDRTILWDFDGTLAWREGIWSGALLQALDRHSPGHGLCRDDIHPRIVGIFPWNHPHVAHPELNRPERWWAHMIEGLTGVFGDLGYPDDLACDLARTTRIVYSDATSFSLFDDTVPTLEALREAGWRHIILSNHVPELPNLVRELGVFPFFDEIISSALTGYEKPHREAFEIGLRAAGGPDEVWMIGDNPIADVEGAEAMGIPAILVRREGDCERRCEDLRGVLEMLA